MRLYRNVKTEKEKPEKPGGKEGGRTGEERKGDRKRESSLVFFSFGIQFPHSLTFRQIAADTNQMKLLKQPWTWQCLSFHII